MFCFHISCLHSKPESFIIKKYQTDVPARGGSSGGGLFNGLSSDDLDDDEAYVDEDSDELMAIRNTGNRLGGQAKRSTHDSRYQSAFGVC